MQTTESVRRGVEESPAARPRSRWLRRTVAAIVTVSVLGAAGLGLLLVATPGAADLPRLVAQRLSAHDSPGLDGGVPLRLSEAVIAVEDSRFESNHGVDARGVARALQGAITGKTEGAATLEQQLAKEIYTPADSHLEVVEDVGLALKIDARFSKSTVMSLYLDAAYFGDGAWGAQAAAEHYFGIEPAALSWAQASLLAGLVQAPSAYDPDGHLSLAKSRQAHVLDRLVSVGTLTRSEAAQILAAPLDPTVSFSG